ncbi:MAG: Coenzyme F420 hydrogenase/dehydrogenase, beta subunit C-terminal domain [Akkermansiaceae bacterium]|nr:Coenzyme F420 hydrogenase/dehydrogenase, beta subunit C-terminal domain [Verrucomicrobiales bacterium]
MCAYICPEQKIELRNVLSDGIRPQVANEDCKECRQCLDICPALAIDHRPLLQAQGLVREVADAFGPVLEIWEGHAADPEIRHTGSSGGALTALCLFCLEEEKMHGVLHVGEDPENPLRNRTRMSRSREELLSAAGSRYAPASACDSLPEIEQAPAPCVFIGQPAEVTALNKAMAVRPELRKKVGLSLSFFCAGSPATQATIDLLNKRGIAPEDVKHLRYRGRGWPGMFGVQRKSSPEFEPLMTYRESWGFLQKYRPFAVHLFPDFSGEDADIASGDPWYREVTADEPGTSILVVRTERGRQLLHRAIKAGFLVLKPSEPWKLLKSQENMIRKRGAIWGRLAALKLLGVPVPEFKGFNLFRNWLRIPATDKLKSVFGTARRAIQRGHRHPRRNTPMAGTTADSKSVLEKVDS